jgi:hypothetical protein
MAIRSTPDQATRTALNKIKLGGLGGQLTPEDQRRISAFEFIEKENARVDAEKNDPYRNLIGQNVRTPSAFNAEASADNLLNSMFGQRQPGQISIAPSTSAPKVFTQGMQTPRGNILGRGEFVDIGDSLGSIATPAGAMQPSMDMSVAPTQPVSARGRGTVLGQAPTPYSTPPIQTSILGDRSSVLDRAIAESPSGRQSQLQRDQFQSQQQLIGQEQQFKRVSQDVASGDFSTLGSLPANMRNFALNEAAKINKELTPSLQQQYLTETDPNKRAAIASAVRLGTTPGPTDEELARTETVKANVGSGTEFIKVSRQSLTSANQQYNEALQVKNAIDSGVTTGAFAKLSGVFKNVVESVFGTDMKAAEQALFSKGIAGLGQIKVRELFRGLGSMSNADRDKGEQTIVNITDPKASILYFVEVSRLNQLRAQQESSLIEKLRKEGKTNDKIESEVLKSRDSYKDISQVAYDTIFPKGTNTAGAAPVASNPAATSAVDEELIKKYLK